MERLWFVPTFAILTLVSAGVVGAFSGILPPTVGFSLLGVSVAVGLVFGIGLAGAAAFASATGKTWRGRAVRGAALPLATALLSIAISSRVDPASGLLHDVSTNLIDPPAFSPEVAARYEAAEPPPDLRAHFDSLQKTAYPELVPAFLRGSPEAAFARALAAAEAMPGWSVRSSDPAAGRIEASATTRVFRFVEDVAIRVRAEGEVTRIDVRSRSRVPIGDLGSNARRIEAYLARLKGPAPR